MTEPTWHLFDYAWTAVGALVAVVWGMLHTKISDHKTALEKQIDDNKTNIEKQIEASNTALSKRIDECNSESDTQRTHIAKLFDKLEQHSQDSFKRHIELMGAINGKADK